MRGEDGTGAYFGQRTGTPRWLLPDRRRSRPPAPCGPRSHRARSIAQRVRRRADQLHAEADDIGGGSSLTAAAAKAPMSPAGRAASSLAGLPFNDRWAEGGNDPFRRAVSWSRSRSASETVVVSITNTGGITGLAGSVQCPHARIRRFLRAGLVAAGRGSRQTPASRSRHRQATAPPLQSIERLPRLRCRPTRWTCLRVRRSLRQGWWLGYRLFSAAALASACCFAKSASRAAFRASATVGSASGDWSVPPVPS